MFEQTTQTSQPYTQYIQGRKLGARMIARVASALLQYRLLNVLLFIEPSPNLTDLPMILSCPKPSSQNKVCTQCPLVVD